MSSEARNPKPDRRRPAHHPTVERYNKPIIVFLTVCSHQRRRILADMAVHDALLSAWKSTSQWRVGRYVVMPDHVHLFCSPAQRDAENIAKWAGYLKRLVSRQLPNLQPLWQRDCWDTQLRSHESYSEKWEYVRNNPVRAGLVAATDDWPYQGTVHHLPW
jgi:putative transposase